MDHTPGQRQFVDLTKYREYYQGKYGLSGAEIEAAMERQRDAHERHAGANRRRVVDLCRDRGIPLASHDDATPEHVAESLADGVALAEFPTTVAAARAAHGHGIAVLMGAPNLVRGGSHSGNVSARTLAEAGMLDILSSDYVPFSLLHAAFALARHLPHTGLPAAVATVTANPACAVGLDDRGSIAPGKRADLLRVRDADDAVLVRAVWRGGARVF
jgi:alpha-D-ribose 1-methylphosphonate 5-triphosphate diphosphatase